MNDSKSSRTRLRGRQRRAANYILAAIGIYILASLTFAPMTPLDGGFFAEIALQPIPYGLIAVALLLLVRAAFIRFQHEVDSDKTTRNV